MKRNSVSTMVLILAILLALWLALNPTKAHAAIKLTLPNPYGVIAPATTTAPAQEIKSVDAQSTQRASSPLFFTLTQKERDAKIVELIRQLNALYAQLEVLRVHQNNVR